ncbi:MAG: HNH endonuclease [Sphaerospermopsis kisseleviana]
MPIPKSLYEQVRQRAQCRCEYCHYPELFSTAPLSIDHLQPQSLGGTDSPDNLALACRRCNERRYNFTTGIDPDTGKETPLSCYAAKLYNLNILKSCGTGILPVNLI